MAVGSGLASSFGYVTQTQYTTGLAVTKFIRHRSVSLQKTATRVQGEGINSGQYGLPSTQFVETVTGASGSVAFDVQSKTMGGLLQTLMGGTSTAAQIGTSVAYTHTHTLSDTFGDYLTVQAGLPQRGGTVTPATVVGAKITEMAFQCAVDGLLQATATLDGYAYNNSTALASVSYASGVNVFHGGQMSVKLGTYNSEAAVSGIRDISVTISRPHDAAAYYAGATTAGTKSEPVLNGATTISGSFTVDMVGLTDFHERVRDNSSTALILEWVGPTLGTSTEKFTIRVPHIVFPNPESFAANGREQLSASFGWEWRDSGTSPTIVQITSDTSI